MNPKQLEEYLELIIKPTLEQYAKENNTTVEELMLNIITIEDTKLFNYKGKQNTVYNRFHDSNIKTLKDLFIAHQNNTINYGKNNNPSNDNYYIHNEIDGIISLLKYKYLRIYPENLKELLNYQININNLYKTLKSCGFNNTITLSIINYIKKENITNITLSEFLSTLSTNQINEILKNNELEIQPFINILRIINDFQIEYNLNRFKSK